MVNEIILVGDVHSNEIKVINWQLKCRQYRDYLPVKLLDCPSYMLMSDTFPRMCNVDFSKGIEAMDKLEKLVK